MRKPPITLHEGELEDAGIDVQPIRSLDSIVLDLHRDDHYMFVVQKSGSFLWEIDFNEVALTGPSLCFITPGQVHRYIDVRNSKGWLVFVDASLIVSRYREIFDICLKVHQSVAIQKEDACFKIIPLLAEALDQESYPFQKEIIDTLTGTFAGLVASKIMQLQNVRHSLNGQKYRNTMRFKQLLAARFKTIKQVKRYASLLNITPLYLNEVVKEITGFPASYWINQEILLEAKRMLFYTTLDVKQIAFELGYEDHTYFSRFFKKNTGMTALEFRNKNHYLSHDSH